MTMALKLPRGSIGGVSCSSTRNGTTAPPRVLLVAEAANPEWTSVPLVGWHHARALAELSNIHLVTQIRNRPAIVRAGLQEFCDFTAIDSDAVARPIWRISSLISGKGKGWTTLTAFGALSYYYFEELLWRRFREDLAAGRFDLVHRLTPLSPTIPSTLAARCARLGIPFVIGPLNGGVSWPKGSGRIRRAEREWLSYMRGAYKLLPGYRSTRRNASAIVVGSIDTWLQIPPVFHDRCVYVPENGIDESLFRRPSPPLPSSPLRAIFVGRLVPYKGADLLLLAAAPLLRSGDLVLEIVGDGPQMNELRSIVAREGLERAVEFTGWVEHSRIPERLCRAHILTFPSIREFGGAVVLEAMALGVVPLVIRYGGPAELVTADTGFLVEIGNRQALIRRVARQLEEIVSKPHEIQRRSSRARERVLNKFTWRAKARQLHAIYEWVLGRAPEKPDFGMPL